MNEFLEKDKTKKVALFRSSSLSAESYDFQEVESWFLQQGLTVVYGDDLKQKVAPEQQVETFISYMADDSIDAIWLWRGGEGVMDWLPYLEPYLEQLKKYKKKYIIGFSDGTLLLNYISSHLNWPTVHGPNALQSALEKVDLNCVNQLLSLIKTEAMPQPLSLEPVNSLARQKQIIETHVVGGNLEMLNVSVKALWEPKLQGRILFIEETGEKPFQIFRTLKYLKHIGWFHSIAALIVGELYPVSLGSESESEYHRRAIEVRLQNLAEDLPCPVLKTSAIGHGFVNHPIMLQTSMCLSLGGECKIAVADSL